MDSILLLDKEWISTLYVGLALLGAGFEVHVLTANGGLDLAQWFTWLSAPSVSDPMYLEYVGDYVEANRISMVIPLTECILTRIWTSDVPWMPLVFPQTTDWQRMLLQDKHAMSDFAAASGALIPQQRRVGSFDCAMNAARELGLPVVLKPPNAAGGESVHIVETEADCQQRSRALWDRYQEPFIVQQYVDGPTYIVGGLIDRGTPVRIYAAQKTELFPPRVGPAQRLYSEYHTELIAAATSVFSALQWTGFASMDFIRGRDGKFYFLELNPRPWGSIDAARQADVDFFTPFSALVRGDSVTPDLRYTPNVHATLFPQRMQSRIQRDCRRSLCKALLDPASWRAVPWRNPALAMHLAKRVYWSYR